MWRLRSTLDCGHYEAVQAFGVRGRAVGSLAADDAGARERRVATGISTVTGYVFCASIASVS